MPAIARLSDLPDGQARGFDLQRSGRDQFFVVRRGTQAFAWRDACPHEGTPMAWRRHEYLNAARTHIACHAHGALFQIDTGLCVQGPCIGQRLQRLPLQVQGDGTLHVQLTETPR